jgi:hypothetical protein
MIQRLNLRLVGGFFTLAHYLVETIWDDRRSMHILVDILKSPIRIACHFPFNYLLAVQGASFRGRVVLVFAITLLALVGSFKLWTWQVWICCIFTLSVLIKRLSLLILSTSCCVVKKLLFSLPLVQVTKSCRCESLSSRVDFLKTTEVYACWLF